MLGLIRVPFSANVKLMRPLRRVGRAGAPQCLLPFDLLPANPVPVDAVAVDAALTEAAAQLAAERSDLAGLSVAGTIAGTEPLVISVVREDADCTSLRVSGELDLATLADALTAQLRAGHRFVRLDLSGLTFCDCSGLRVFVHAHHAFLDVRGTLILTAARRAITGLLAITALDDVLLTMAEPTTAAPQGPRHGTALPRRPRPAGGLP